ncbi:MAG: hypothetical protein RMY28_037375 [Nostoc sp. ChiSLP01]|nr:hypothetical protein [Nostoc sp. CmiSLP01]MDZ8287353.1 hypothetical protein [Nostoc sp. ChiSLP01]
MTNEDLTESLRPLVEYIKIEIPIICEQHAQVLANQLVAALPRLFAERPEIFSQALSTAGQIFSRRCPCCGSTNTMSKPLCLFSVVCCKCGHDWMP